MTAAAAVTSFRASGILVLLRDIARQARPAFCEPSVDEARDVCARFGQCLARLGAVRLAAAASAVPARAHRSPFLYARQRARAPQPATAPLGGMR